MKHYEYWPPNKEGVLLSLQRLFESDMWWKSKGDLVAELEQRFANVHDCRFGISVCNATIALDLVLRTLGVGQGDQVVLPAYNFYSHPQSVTNVGATPIFVDVSRENLTLDSKQVESLDLSKVKAIVAVHISGSIAELDRLAAFAQANKIPLIEDAAQAHAASYDGRKVGSWGVAGIFSFGGKKLMSCGQGGIITTSDPEFYEKCYALVNRGRTATGRNTRQIVGENYQLSELAAAVLLPQLEVLEEVSVRREQTIRLLDKSIAGIDGFMPLKQFPKTTRRSHYMYSFLYTDSQDGRLPRDRLLDLSKKAGLPFIAGYKCVNHDAKLFERYAQGKIFPAAEWAESSVIGILHPYLLHDWDYWQKNLDELRKILRGKL